MKLRWVVTLNGEPVAAFKFEFEAEKYVDLFHHKNKENTALKKGFESKRNENV